MLRGSGPGDVGQMGNSGIIAIPGFVDRYRDLDGRGNFTVWESSKVTPGGPCRQRVPDLLRRMISPMMNYPLPPSRN
jgi:hypothetical protein